MTTSLTALPKFAWAANQLSRDEQAVLIGADSSTRFLDLAINSPSFRASFEKSPEDECLRLTRFVARALARPGIANYIEHANVTGIGAAVQLFAVALDAEPICVYARSRRASSVWKAVQFVETGLEVLEQDQSAKSIEDAVSPTEAGDMLGVAPNTVKAWARRGWFGRWETTPGGHWKLSRAAVSSFQRQRLAAEDWATARRLDVPRGDSDTDV